MNRYWIIFAVAVMATIGAFLQAVEKFTNLKDGTAVVLSPTGFYAIADLLALAVCFTAAIVMGMKARDS